jgi:hypothetical protein
MEMEKKIETVTVTTADGREAIFEVIENPASFTGRRAYVKGKTMYYDLPVFEAGLAKAASVKRVAA